MDDDAKLDSATRRDLAQTLLEETERLDRFVRDLLDMTRLESGGVRVKKEWQNIEEIVGAAFTRLETRLQNRKVTARCARRFAGALRQCADRAGAREPSRERRQVHGGGHSDRSRRRTER